ncbi:predicted protein [Sclerotinia sclerotiorum 1980 UF-70]|uniref:Uncharacterized protein n=1 Tax=Sclerotinia sclerotiorum (strain ATCC 18683 / 1980 / Ss-1) TaxID=665079 RepID=A7EYJ6_SCLS1|nr:predicted protein [Sclerotinia sclerotiorum 1980 UF-70]EDN94538.1 predicted protein [Sclerotinia sclerotiorum 1980 UF-70]
MKISCLKIGNIIINRFDAGLFNEDGWKFILLAFVNMVGVRTNNWLGHVIGVMDGVNTWGNKRGLSLYQGKVVPAVIFGMVRGFEEVVVLIPGDILDTDTQGNE